MKTKSELIRDGNTVKTFERNLFYLMCGSFPLYYIIFNFEFIYIFTILTYCFSHYSFIQLVYQISQAYFSNSDLFSLDLVSESKITIAQAQSLWQLMLAN